MEMSATAHDLLIGYTVRCLVIHQRYQEADGSNFRLCVWVGVCVAHG